MKTCGNCSAGNADAAKFCNECGTALASKGGPGNQRQKGGDSHQRGRAVEDQTRRTAFDDQTRRSDQPAKQFEQTHRESQSSQGEFQSSDQFQTQTGQFQSPSPKVTARPPGLKYKVEDLKRIEERRKADIIFVLDCTSSMRGEIEAIKDAIMQFVDSIQSSGVRARVGLVKFRDRLNGERQRVLKFKGEALTTDAKAFRSAVSTLKAKGGGDEPESSLDALMLAVRQPFDVTANKVIVLVTDAPPHIPDKETKSIEEVAEAIRTASVRQLYLVIRTQEAKNQIYLKLLEGTRGMAFELGKGDDFRSRAADFQRTLMALGKTISSATR